MAKVFTSSVLAAPVERVWAIVRDFDALPVYNPGVVASRIEEGLPSDRVGCVRAFELAGGERLRERLLALDDRARSCTYSILEAPLPVEGYVATLRLLPITDGDRTYIEWSADFACPPEEEAALVERIGKDVFQASFDKLATLVG